MSPADPAAKLVHMANQIASFFRSYPDAEAHAGIREHLLHFWTPGMRATLLARAGAAGLDPLVAAALRRDVDAESPTTRQVDGPAEGGQLASDAG